MISMECRGRIVFHKKEWDRLQKQAGPLEKPPDEKHLHDRSKYLQAMNEKSQEWTKNWPDNVESAVATVEKRRKRQNLKNIAFVKSFREKEKNKKSDCIALARQKIFDNSCYGKQLLSTILESKVIEERQAQIEFKKTIRGMMLKHEKDLESKIASMSNNLYDTHKKHEEDELARKKAVKDTAKINRNMHKINLLKIAKAKDKEIQLEIKDAKLMKRQLEYEAQAKKECKALERQAVKQCEAEQKVVREQRRKVNEMNDALVQVACKYQDTIRCKEQLVWKKIIDGHIESNKFINNYKIIEKAQKRKKEIYDKFIQKGIEDFEKRQQKEDEEISNKNEKSHRELLQMTKDYKAAAEEKEFIKHCNKCFCDMQCLFTKSHKRMLNNNSDSNDDNIEKKSFLLPYNKLSEELKKREKEPTPWNGLKQTNEFFAKQAAATLKECKYKNMTRKVIDNYRKIHFMDSNSLPVPDY